MKYVCLLLLLICCDADTQAQRVKYNFNPDWAFSAGDDSLARHTAYDDAAWKRITLPPRLE